MSIVTITAVYHDQKAGYKIFRLQFPLAVIPFIGMRLRDEHGHNYIISGTVFEPAAKDMWDCKI